MNINEWLRDIYYLVEKRKDLDSSEISFQIFDLFNKLFIREEFKTANDILEKVDLSRLDSGAVRSFLVAPNWAKDKLPYKEKFNDACWKRMIELRVLKLLKGYCNI